MLSPYFFKLAKLNTVYWHIAKLTLTIEWCRELS